MLGIFPRRLIITILLTCLFFCVQYFTNLCDSAFAKTEKVLGAASKSEYINLEWWENFNDETLIEHIMCALNNNYDLKNSGLEIENLRQTKNMEISKLFPSLSVGANYLGLKIPQVAFPFQGFRDNSFALPFLVNWEIDLFGKRKNKIDMHRETLKGAAYEEKWASITLASEVAGVYFNISNLNEQINIQNEIVKNRTEKFLRVKKSYEAGVSGYEDLNNAAIAVQYEEIILNGYKKQREEFLHRLAFLEGQTPKEAEEYSFKNIKEIEYTGKIPDCISSDVTISRPDVLKKEAALKRAKIDITLARKEFLPNVNVFGVLVFSTLTPNFGWKGASANLLAGATQNIFSGGRRIFNLKQKKVEWEQALNDYLKADLNALKEINDALYFLKEDAKIYDLNLKNLALEENNFVRVSNSFKEGVSGMYDVLDKRRDFLQEESQMLNSKVQKLADLISLYKATGGCL